MQELKNQILEFVSKRGPVLPIKLAQEFNTSLLMASALLSELVSNKKLKITSAKIGSSPLYYLQGQEYKLNILHPHLNQREREACDLLQKRKVLRDIKVQPHERVALRTIRDFAVPMRVKISNQEEIFWRWHLLPESVAKDLIKKTIEPENLLRTQETKKVSELKEREPSLKEESRKEIVKEKIIKEESKIEKEQEIQKPLVEEKKEKIKPSSKFDELLINLFDQNGFKIIEKNIVRKNTDHEFIISIPSKLGQIRFFTKAKAKAKVSDADLSLALSNAKTKNLPLLFLAKGEPTKKAKTFIEQNNVIFRRL